VAVKKIDKTSLTDLCDSDAIIMGSPTYYGAMSGKLKTLIDKSVKIHGKLDGKVGAAFTSSGGTATGAETTLLSILHAMMVHGMVVQGMHDDAHYGVASVNPTSKKSIERCREFGKRTAALAVKLKK
jgi:NAD(P)H dehydrogenase (quinone)